MESLSVPALVGRPYRQELHTLTYVTLDAANGGIVRNLSQEGVAIQAVAALRQQQRVRVRFELRFPRLRLDASGQVSWANSSGQCGIQFTDLSERTRQQIGEWIFSSLLDTMAREAENPGSIFPYAAIGSAQQEGIEENIGLTVSSATRPVIRLEASASASSDTPVPSQDEVEDLPNQFLGSRSLSGRALAWLIDSLIVIAGLCLFVVIFLSIARELPQWRLTLAAALVAATFVVAAYWTISVTFGGLSLGARLAQAAIVSPEKEEEDAADRFR